jgi:predicted NBD/HSP70 family sugar kinase
MGDTFKVVVVDVGGTHIRATTVDGEGTVVHRVSMSAEGLRSGNSVDVLSQLILQMLDAVGDTVAGIVIGVPGILDRSRRTIVKTPLLPALDGIGLADAIEERFGIPAFLDHDATLQTRGEASRGSAEGRDVVLGVYFGTGVGAALIDRGQLMGGIYRMQLGHVPWRGDGRIGTGGAIDCVEAYASGLLLEALAAKHDVPVAGLFAENGPGELQEALRTFVRDQALAVALSMTLTDPEIVVIGGGVTEMSGYPFDDLVRTIDERLSPILGRGQRPVVRATLGPDAASWGALTIVCDALANRTGPATSGHAPVG